MAHGRHTGKRCRMLTHACCPPTHPNSRRQRSILISFSSASSTSSLRSCRNLRQQGRRGKPGDVRGGQPGGRPPAWAVDCGAQQRSCSAAFRRPHMHHTLPCFQQQPPPACITQSGVHALLPCHPPAQRGLVLGGLWVWAGRQALPQHLKCPQLFRCTSPWHDRQAWGRLPLRRCPQWRQQRRSPRGRTVPLPCRCCWLLWPAWLPGQCRCCKCGHVGPLQAPLSERPGQLSTWRQPDLCCRKPMAARVTCRVAAAQAVAMR